MRRIIVGISLFVGLGVGFTAGAMTEAENGVVDRGGSATICAEPCDEYCQELGYSDGYCSGRRCVCIE